MKNNSILSLGHEFKSFVQSALKQQRPIKFEEGLSFYILTCFLLFRYSEDPDYKILGDSLIRVASDGLFDCESLNFSDGIPGLGWVVEQLSQNIRVLEVNTDEVLEEVDSLIYKSVLYSDGKSGIIGDEFIGALFYFDRRTDAKQPQRTHPYKRLSVYASAKMLVERIHDFIDPCLESLISFPGRGAEPPDIVFLIKIFYFLFSNKGKTSAVRSEDKTLHKIVDAITSLEGRGTLPLGSGQVSHLLSLQLLSLTLVLMGDQVRVANLRKTGESLYRRLNDQLFIEGLTIEEKTQVQVVYAFCLSLQIPDDLKKSCCELFLSEQVHFDFEQYSSVGYLISLLLMEMKEVLHIYDLLIGTFIVSNQTTGSRYAPW